jgi:catechol 2,3-dioxygenase-like lactoylglutathione lyase family enzyme
VLTGISPVLLSSDIDRSIEYFRDRLGFECTKYGDGFATATRDGQTILLALTHKPIVPNWQLVDKTGNAYIRVDNVDEIYAEVQERGAGIDYTLYDAPHGFREFGVQDPDGHDIAFGQPLNG